MYSVPEFLPGWFHIDQIKVACGLTRASMGPWSAKVGRKAIDFGQIRGSIVEKRLDPTVFAEAFRCVEIGLTLAKA